MLFRSNGEALVEACVARLRQGRTLLLFPEGTRSPQGRIGSLRRGAARVALRSGEPLLPVVITCEPPTFMKGQRWYEVPQRTAHLTIRFDEPIDWEGHEVAGSLPIAARRLTDAIRDRYERRLCAIS